MGNADVRRVERLIRTFFLASEGGDAMDNPIAGAIAGGAALVDGLAKAVVVLLVACVVFVPLGMWKAIELASAFLAWVSG